MSVDALRIRGLGLVLGVAILAAAACGDDDGDAIMPGELPDAGAPPSPGNSFGDTPPLVPGMDFDASAPAPSGDPPADIPSMNNYPDSTEDDDAGVVRPRGCLEVEPGDEVTVQGELIAARTWRRIEAGMCPAMTLSALTVPYQPIELCRSDSERTLEIIMRGADMFEGETAAAVLDPLLVVYPNLDYLTPRPFECLASNDDGIFEGLQNNSSRIEGLSLAARAPAVIIASTRDEATQRGTGLFSLTVRAR